MRVLVTGLSHFWGGRLAQSLERRDDVEVIVGLDTREPRLPLERTEFVRSDSSYSILSRIVQATAVDTILHTHLVVDSTLANSRTLHEINVIGTMNLLAAAGASGSPVRRMIVKSSGLVYGSSYRDPAFFREDTPRASAPRTGVERSLLEVEGFVRDFAFDNPHVTVTLLRFANVLGDDIETPFARALQLPVVPMVAGFDPRLQFVHEDDVNRALVYTSTREIPGVYNVAGDGVLPWSEICRILGKRRLPMPPVGTVLAASPMRLMRVVDYPPEVLALLRYGRVMDTGRFKRAGFQYRYTTAGTVEAFGHGQNLAGAIGEKNPSYRYERDVEHFFRHSPAVVRRGTD
jgi:UDP-glucose 4-epimerase